MAASTPDFSRSVTQSHDSQIMAPDAPGNPTQPEQAQKSADCRRRSERCHQAILAAAAELLEEKGYGGVSVEAIASRAGVGKQTIYRWWPCKASVVMEAYAERVTQNLPLPDTGNVRTDLIELLGQLATVLGTTSAGRALAGLIAEAQTDLHVAQEFRTQLGDCRRAAVQILLQRGIARGELHPDLDLELAIDLLCGPIWYRLLQQHAPLNREFAIALVDQLIAGMGTGR